MTQTPQKRDPLVAELYRLKSRKSYYKNAAAMWRYSTIAIAVVCALLVGVIALGNTPDDARPVEGFPPADQNIDCPECETLNLWSDVEPEPIETAFTATDATPDYILASVHMANGNNCSGTVIGDDDHADALIVSCAHCVAGNVGASCWWHLPTGKAFRAELIAFDRAIDVSVFKVDRADVIATTKLVTPNGWSPTASTVRACGYPRGRGPNLKSICYTGAPNINGGMARWSYRVTAGTFEPGDSGGGVFYDGYLAGVITHKNGSRMFTTPQPDVFQYVSEIAAKTIPDVEIAGQCPGGNCPPRRRNAPDWGDERAPAPPFTPTPNVPINPPSDRNRIRDRDRDDSIAEILKRLEALEIQIEELGGNDNGGGELAIKIDSLRGRLDLLNLENGSIVDRLELLEKSIDSRFAALTPGGDIPPAVAQAIAEIQVEIQTIQNSNAQAAPEIDIDELIGQLPKIPIRVVDEQGNTVDSETYKIGEQITLFGRYRSRAAK